MKSRTSLDSAMYPIATLLLMSGAIHVAILAITGRSWMGPLSLRKPATFGLSFGLTLITVTWVSSFLRMGERTRARLLSTFAAACVLETALITLQAWRGVPSHFNVETTADAIVAQALAAGGATLVVIVAALTLLSFRSSPETPASMRVAIRTGFVLLMASMVTGGLMIAKGMRLVFQGDPQGAYQTGGSLKLTHAATMHAILVLPLLAWLLSRTSWSERRQARAVAFASATYTVIAATVAAANAAGALP
jgi:hypothetical protein